MTSTQIISLAVLIAPIVLSLAGALYQLLLQHLPTARRDQLREIVASVVTAVEQIGNAQHLSSVDKKQRAVTFVNTIASDLHLPAPSALVDIFIEEAVSLLPGNTSPPAA